MGGHICRNGFGSCTRTVIGDSSFQFYGSSNTLLVSESFR